MMGSPRGMLIDANPLLPYGCDKPAIRGQSCCSSDPEEDERRRETLLASSVAGLGASLGFHHLV